MTEKSLVKYTRKNYDKYLNDKSVLELIDIMGCLDENKPYIELSHNGEVGKFLKGKYADIPVDNAKDFDSFYKCLYNKIEELAGTDKRVKIFLEQANYQKEFNELPRLMNRLERFSLDTTKPKFEAVLEYVYDAVMNQGVKIDDNWIKIYKIDSTSIKPKVGEVCINIHHNNELFNIHKKKGKEELGIQIACLGGLDQSGNWYYPILDIESATEKIKNFMLNNKDESEILIKDMGTIFSLPKIMNNYLKKKIKELEDCMKGLK